MFNAARLPKMGSTETTFAPEILDQPAFTPRKLRVIAIGAGFSNLTLAYKHKHKNDRSFIDLKIYEKNPEIGGTWVT